MEYPDYVNVLRGEHPDLATQLAPFDGLEQVLPWLKRLALPPGSVDIVGQDEFSYDFLIHLPEDRWLVFGVN